MLNKHTTSSMQYKLVVHSDLELERILLNPRNRHLNIQLIRHISKTSVFELVWTHVPEVEQFCSTPILTPNNQKWYREVQRKPYFPYVKIEKPERTMSIALTVAVRLRICF